jgi:hypothetical protein
MAGSLQTSFCASWGLDREGKGLRFAIEGFIDDDGRIRHWLELGEGLR